MPRLTGWQSLQSALHESVLPGSRPSTKFAPYCTKSSVEAAGFMSVQAAPLLPQEGSEDDAVVEHPTSLLGTEAIGSDLLTADEETELARRIEDGHDAERALLRAELLPAEKVRLERCAEYGREARRRIIEANLRLVMSVAYRYRAASMEMEDLIQEGNLGLIRAVDKFDWRRGYKFSTYAVWWIRQAIGRAIADKGQTIRVPVHMQGVFGRVRRARAAMYAATGSEPSAEELAAETGLPEEIVISALASPWDVVSLDSKVGEEDGIALGELIEDTTAIAPSDSAGKAALRAETRAALECLAEKERHVIELRYGLADGQEHTLDDVGRSIGLTRERVRQIEAKAFRKLRQGAVARRLHSLLE